MDTRPPCQKAVRSRYLIIVASAAHLGGVQPYRPAAPYRSPDHRLLHPQKLPKSRTSSFAAKESLNQLRIPPYRDHDRQDRFQEVSRSPGRREFDSGLADQGQEGFGRWRRRGMFPMDACSKVSQSPKGCSDLVFLMLTGSSMTGRRWKDSQLPRCRRQCHRRLPHVGFQPRGSASR